MLSKYGKLLLGAYILKKFISEDSNQVSEQKTNGIMSRCGKLILATYLVNWLKSGKHYGTREHEESTGGLLHKHGKLMLTTYAVKKLKPKKSEKEAEKPDLGMKSPVHGSLSLLHRAKKYGKWALGVYLLRKFKHPEPEAKIKEVVDKEAHEEGKGPSMITFNRIVVGVLAGVTAIVGALAGVTAINAIKKYRAKHCGHKSGVE
ncbi:MAG TPA: hypothetical protein HA306_03435 [Methanosarcina sp.]|nr:hypothetical protein [Methanosarcina sp.]